MFLFKRNGIYYIEYFDSEVRKKKRVSTGQRSKAEALKYFKTFLPKSQKEKTPKPILASNFLDEYYAFAQGSFSKSYLRSVQLSSKMLINFLGDKKLKEITPKDVEYFISTTYSRAKYSAHLYYRTLKAAFSKAVNWGYIDSNPFQKVKPAKTQKKLPAFITPEQLTEIVKNEKSSTLQDIYTTAFYTGLRISELLNLQWDNVDLDKMRLIVGNSNEFVTKGKEARIVPIIITLMPIFHTRRLYSISKYVFVDTNGKKFNADYVSKSFKKVVKKCGLPTSIHFHTLRHSFASRLAQKGVSLYIIKEILGHRDVSTTQVYAHLNNSSLMNAINKLNE